MAASIIAVSGLMPARDLNGRAVVATINIYANLTTTPEPVYTTSDLTVPISQPVTSDDAGRFPILWIDSSKTVTMAWATADGQTRTVTGLTGSTAASSALTDDANAALAAIEAIAGDIDGFAENVAAAAASAVAAAASETASAASATTAAGSVTSAGTQATNAANSATAASVAQSAAEAARDQAEASAPALLMTFAASTTDADPGAGLLRLNHATLSSATAAYVDNVDANGNTISGTIDTWDDSTSTDKGTVTFREGATGKVANYSLTGSVVDGTGYRKLTLTWQSGATGGFTAAAAIGITFSRTGNAGADGAGIGDLLASNNLSDLADAATARTNLGLAIGTNVQAYDATLGGLAAVTTAADKLIYATGADTFATTDITSVARTLNGQTTQALMRTAGLGMSADASALVAAADKAAMRVSLDVPALTGNSNLAGAINTSRATVASHATTADIWAALGQEINFTGTATITDFPDAPQAGAHRVLHCAGACIFTHNANIFVPGSANFTCAAGDIVEVHAITTSTFRLRIAKASGLPTVTDGVPVGCILLWSGAIVAIPAGWALCNGSSGTPDLRNKFIVGAGSTYAVAATGGAVSGTPTITVGATTLSTAQMPAHTHAADTAVFNTGAVSHALTNTHTTDNGTTSSTGGGGSHTHTASATIATLPPYYALAYIQKL